MSKGRIDLFSVWLCSEWEIVFIKMSNICFVINIIIILHFCRIIQLLGNRISSNLNKLVLYMVTTAGHFSCDHSLLDISGHDDESYFHELNMKGKLYLLC